MWELSSCTGVFLLGPNTTLTWISVFERVLVTQLLKPTWIWIYGHHCSRTHEKRMDSEYTYVYFMFGFKSTLWFVSVRQENDKTHHISQVLSFTYCYKHLLQYSVYCFLQVLLWEPVIKLVPGEESSPTTFRRSSSPIGSITLGRLFKGNLLLSTS